MRCSIQIILIILILGFSRCSDETQPSRTYRMGMANSAPRFDDLDLFIQSLNLWTQRVDAAIISTEVPWEELLAGMNAEDYAIANYQGLVEFYRDKDLELWIYIDPQNGLDRSSDALELQAAGKSIADTEMQLLYKRFSFVMDSLFHPEHLGLALETNLIRDAAPSSIYQGVKQAANAAAAEISGYDPDVSLSVSVQVDHAWGKLVGGSYTGIEQDFIDFPFVEELGLSSYPYIGFDSPDDLPIDYYSKLVKGKNIPVFVSEGGWSSASFNSPDISFTSSPEKQETYIRKQAALLDHANASGVFQLTFTDIDLDHIPPDVPENIVLFSFLGLVDSDLMPKPALSAWDDLFELPLKSHH